MPVPIARRCCSKAHVDEALTGQPLQAGKPLRPSVAPAMIFGQKIATPLAGDMLFRGNRNSSFRGGVQTVAGAVPRVKQGRAKFIAA